MKFKPFALFVLIAATLVACNPENIDFSYSPDKPRAGQSIRFTNLCTDGDEWLWTYSDGTTSTAKNPSKVFREPGEYTVTLQVDGKKYQSVTKAITIYDTVPMIVADVDSLLKYEIITLSADYYNPYNYEVTYNWSYPEEATLLSENTTSSAISMYFIAAAQHTVNLTFTIGEDVYELTYSFEVYDTPSTSILLADENQIYRIPYYSTHFEEPRLLTETQFDAITTILCRNDQLYVLDAQKAIYNINLSNLRQETVISLSGTDKGFYHGALVENALYWTDQYTTLYRMPAQLRDMVTDGTKYIFANANDFNDLTFNHNGGIATYINSYFWATGAGIAILQAPNGTAQFQQTILNDYDIADLQIDQMARKIYCLTVDNQFFIVNIDGSNARVLADNVHCFTLDIDNNRLYFVSGTTLYQTQLIQSPNNQSTFTLTTIVENLHDIKSIVLDNAKR